MRSNMQRLPAFQAARPLRKNRTKRPGEQSAAHGQTPRTDTTVDPSTARSSAATSDDGPVITDEPEDTRPKGVCLARGCNVVCCIGYVFLPGVRRPCRQVDALRNRPLAVHLGRQHWLMPRKGSGHVRRPQVAAQHFHHESGCCQTRLPSRVSPCTA